MKTYKLNAWGKNYDVSVNVANYFNNKNIAVTMDYFDEDCGCWFPYATVTVNLRDLDDGFAFVDTNNCPWAEDFINDNRLGKFTGEYGYSGWCAYPLYKFDMAKIKDVA